MKQIINFLMDEEGATAIEYSIMVVAIAAVIVVVVFVIGGKVDDSFESVNTQLTD